MFSVHARSIAQLLAAIMAMIYCSLPFASRAADIPQPSGEVILTIDGDISNANGDGQANFDMAMLQSLPTIHFRTSTPWTTEVTEFEGVSLDEILKYVGAKGKTLHAVALNDYAADVPIDNASGLGGIIAYKTNGKEMPIREKGPLWIVFPFDDRPELKSEMTYSWCVWQLRKLTVNQ